jgi:hypothetical protein
MATKTARDREPRPDDRDVFYRVRIVEEISKVVRTGLVAGCTAFIFYRCSEMVKALAGRNTLADVGIKILGNITISEGLAYALAAICVGFGVQRGYANRQLSARLSRLSQLEAEIDPNRSSSHLTVRGLLARKISKCAYDAVNCKCCFSCV